MNPFKNLSGSKRTERQGKNILAKPVAHPGKTSKRRAKNKVAKQSRKANRRG